MAKSKQAETSVEEDVLDVQETLKETVEKSAGKAYYYWIRPKYNEEDVIGLGKYGKSLWTDCAYVIQPIYNDRLKKYLTGLDENDPEVMAIKDTKERESRRAEITKTRKELEDLTGFDLSPNSTYWDTEVMIFSEKSKPLVPYLNPNDRIKVEWLKRRGDVPFGSSDLYNSKYSDAKFYIETEDEAVDKRKNRKNLQKEAIAASVMLENDYDKLWKICYLLGINKKYNVNINTLIDGLDEWIERNKKFPDTLERLTNLYKKSIQYLEIFADFEEALYYSILQFDSPTKTYYRGGLNFGQTKAECVDFLLSPTNMYAYVELKDALNSKKKNSRGLD
jgi:hypothetical protein